MKILIRTSFLLCIVTSICFSNYVSDCTHVQSLYHARREGSAATAAFTSQAVDQRYNLRAAEQPSGLDCTHVQSLYQKSMLISVCFCKISVAIRKYLRISLIFVYYDKLTPPYIFTFFITTLYLPDYTVIISFLLFAPYFFRGC